jgi:Clostripain family
MASDNSASKSSGDRPPKWTVMVFMGADTIEGNAPLGDAVDADLDEMRFVGGGKNLDIFVQVHGRGKPRRHHFGQGADGKPTEDVVPVPNNELDYQDGRALSDFIKDSIMKVRHRREDYSMLVLWGHAYDFAFGRSLTSSGTVVALDFAELRNVLRGLQDKMLRLFKTRDRDPSENLPKLDIVGFDACDIATVEIACQLEPFAKFLLGSQIGIPIPGWPYDRILGRLKNPQGTLMTAPEFGSYVVRRFCESYEASKPVTLTLLNLTHAPRLFELAEELAVELAIAVGNPQTRDRIIDLFFGSQTEDGKPFVDVADLCLSLMSAGGHPSLVQRALELGDFLAGPQGKVVGLSDTGKGRPLVAEHGRNAGRLVRLNGLSLYAPFLAPSDDPGVVRNLYQKFVFAQKTRWSDMVHNLENLS